MGEGIQQQAGDRAIQIGQARDVILNLVTGITRLPTDYASRIQNFLIEYLGTPKQPVPFGGRDADLGRLDAWLADPQASPYLLLAATAGRGKSALLVRWSQRLLAQSDTSLVFVPISIRFRTNLAPVVFAALAARLAHLYGEEVPQNADLTAEQWRGLVSTYLARTPPDECSLLLILDGVDEAADWEPSPDLFPLTPPSGLRVIVSARYRAGDADAAPWLRRLGWERPGLACSLDLDPLARPGVANVLQKMGFPLDVLARDVDIVTELHRLSQGDPLLVRLYVDDLWARGEAAARLRPEDLRAIRPGLKGYFDRWWEDQRCLWGPDAPLKEPAVQALLNLLACALGPLNREDVLTLAGDLGLTTWTLEEALRPLARFVVGDGKTQGYVFSHSRLGEYFREEWMTGVERLAWQQRFLNWGKQTLARLDAGMLAPEKAPAYVVQYYGAHLERMDGPAESLFVLVSDGWRRAWEVLEGSYAGFLNDAERAWRAAKMVNGMEAAKGSPASQLGMEVRSALCLVSVNTLARNIHPMLLAALVEQGMCTPAQGLAYARQVPDPEQQAAALIGLVSGLPEAERAEVLGEALVAAQAAEWEQRRAEAMARLAPHLPEPLLREALAAAWAIEDARWRAEALIGLAPRLAELGYPQEALVAARAIESERIRAKALAKLAAYLPEPLLIETLAVAREMRDSDDRAKILTGLVPHLSEPLKGETVREALAMAREMRDSDDRAWALTELAPHLPEAEQAEALMEALTVAQEIKIESVRAEALAGLAPHLPEALLGQAMTAARAIEWEGARAEALAGLAPHLPEAERAKAVREVLAAAWVIGDEDHRTWVLAGMILGLAELGHPGEALMAARAVDSSLASWAWIMAELVPHLPEAERVEVLREVLTAARVMGDEDDQAKALAGLAPHLPEPLLKEALAAAREIRDEQDQAKALVRLAPHLPEPLLREALSAAQTIRNGSDQARTLAGLAPHLAGPLLREALAAAREIKWEWALAAALAGLAPYLPETERTEALQEALAAAREIKLERERAEALADLAPYLPEAERVAAQGEALAAARAIRDGNDQAKALARLAPYLLEPLLREAMAVAWEIKWEWARAVALTGLIPRLAELGHPREALAEVWEIEWERERSQVLIGLVPCLPKPLLRETLAAVQEIESEDGRAKALVALLPHLPEAERTGVLREALAAARETESELARAKVLAGLILHLPEAERAEALGEALAAARAIRWEDNRAEALVGLAPHLAQLPCQRLYPLWQETLPILATRTRKDLLADLRTLAPVIATLGGAQAVVETFHAIQDVGRWWP